MKAGRGSRTAELVCMGRAVAHVAPPFPGFSDPTARDLLPENARMRVGRATAPARPKGLRANVDRGYLLKQSAFMALRTAAIDDAIRKTAARQVVILGAGLDGRAWRLPELSDAIVFEVDHPDSQRDKRARVGALTPTAREVRFLAVDFARDSLEAALANAGHDVREPTMWVWEGVVMYLTPADVEATLAVLERRSAPGSALSITYAAPAPMLRVVGLIVRLLGEPFRSAYTADQMAALLVRHGFRPLEDVDLPTLGARRSPELARAAKVAPHLRIVTAERA
jgi:methyltransferase (TIGR00027 family)